MGIHVSIHRMGLELEVEDDNTMYLRSVFLKEEDFLTNRPCLTLDKEEGRRWWWKTS